MAKPICLSTAFASQPELFAAVAEAIEAQTRADAVLVIFEDAHWADPGSLALLEFLAGVVAGQRLFLRTERARKALTMRIGTALKAIETLHPELARHLRNSVSTGRFCSYRPDQELTWQLTGTT